METKAVALKQENHRLTSTLFSRCLFCPLCLDTLVNFFTVYRDIAWGIYTNPYLVPFDPKHSYGDFVTNHQSFTNTASKY